MRSENIDLLTGDDILLVTYPGSGTTWLANVLSELSLPYIDGYDEKLTAKDSFVTELFPGRDQSRTPILRENAKRRVIDECGRIIKTHLWPHHFSSVGPKRAIYLVRDGRDAVLSYYHWRLSFSEEGELGTFLDFLSRPGINNLPPLRDWAFTYLKWREFVHDENFCLVRFEDSKSDALMTVQKVLKFLGVTRNDKVLLEAIQNSTFERMQQTEAASIDGYKVGRDGLIMRSGQIGQWRRSFGKAEFQMLTPEVCALLVELGYSPK